jgi:hypothetical protein
MPDTCSRLLARTNRSERAEHIAEWIRLSGPKKVVAPVEEQTEEARQEMEESQSAISAQVEPKTPRRRHDIPTGNDRGRPESGINAAVRELGIERNEAQPRTTTTASPPRTPSPPHATLYNRVRNHPNGFLP